METTIYEPNKHIKLGIKIWPLMFKDLWDSRELTWRLFVRDFSAKYKQALFGFAWAVLMPFVAIGTFVFLNKAGIINIGKTDVPYPLFALIGLSVWQLFATGLTAGTNSLVSAGAMIVKINFPRECLVFASMAQAMFEFFVKLILILIFFVVFKVMPSWGIILFPLSLIPILLFTLGLSLILSLANGVMRDIANFVSPLTALLMFLTPVLYPAEGPKAFFFKLNPLSALVSAPRDIILHGVIKDPIDFVVSSIIALLIFFISWRIFYIAETKIPERI